MNILYYFEIQPSFVCGCLIFLQSSFYFFQIFRQLERPAEVERLQELKTVVKTQREKFINVIVNNTDVNNLDELLKFELAKYEAVS